MAGFSSYDDLINEMTTNGKQFDFSFFKTSSTPEAAGVWHSLWKASGTPGAGADPAAFGTGTSYTNNAGSINLPARTPDIKTLVTFGATATQNCVLMLYDRLVGYGAIPATVQNNALGAVTLPRYGVADGLNGVGVEAWVELTTASTAAGSMTLSSYTDHTGATGQTGPAFALPAAATNTDVLVKVPLAAGSLGIRSVQNLNVTGSPTAAVMNLILIHPLAYIPIIANQWNERDLVLQFASLPRVWDGATLALAMLASGTTATTVFGNLKVAWG
ncbi:hypothetical protein UFOVP434_61 [uncultured Caudovirales phage]|uniref:Uncharacterized protein n=1 Tax=uncultured Caudovirales phage TaxID=2100421 RepID=A0A6J5MDH8_9CAUD|nr:hypothetical protein UFOVP434_61 [uncultured Caudovirales phage]